MKKMFLILLMALGVQSVQAQQNYRLLRNNRLETPSGAQVLIRGVAPEQEIVAIAPQSPDNTLTALGYNAAAGQVQLYSIHPITFDALQLGALQRSPDLGNGRNLVMSYLPGEGGHAVLSLTTAEGLHYDIDASSGVLLQASGRKNWVAYDHPYSGVTRPADEFVRNQGLINTDPVAAEASVSNAARNPYTAQAPVVDQPVIVSLYPNPARGIARLQLSAAPSRVLQLYIVDLNGRIVQEYEFTAGTAYLDADVSSLAPGLYSLQLMQDGMVLDQAQKLVRSAS